MFFWAHGLAHVGMERLCKCRLQWRRRVQCMSSLSQRLHAVLRQYRVVLGRHGLLLGRDDAERDGRRLLWRRMGGALDAALLPRSHDSCCLLSNAAIAITAAASAIPTATSSSTASASVSTSETDSLVWTLLRKS